MLKMKSIFETFLKTHLGWSNGIDLGPESELLLKSQVRFSLVPI
jgi:hypothetical protein